MLPLFGTYRITLAAIYLSRQRHIVAQYGVLVVIET